ncbi:MAG: protein kinase, partial [Planctomycetota bacterium]
MTTPWERVRELFLAAFDRPQDERAGFLAEQCGDDEALRREVQSLLEEAEQPDALFDDPLWMVAGASDHAGDLPGGTRLGPFRIEAPIARGGMSRVYRARQRSPNRAVALKVLGAGLDADSSRWRFEQEIRILARLDHPNIARIYSAGMHTLSTAEGAELTLPYFGMELIEGALPVTDFAAARELDVRDRLILIETIARAIHYGHRLGIIHRDLKPVNPHDTKVNHLKSATFQNEQVDEIGRA